MSNSLKSEVAAAAASLVVHEGLEYGQAKRRAVHQLNLGPRTALPDNAEVEEAVREHIALFCADTQPSELAELRRIAMVWMERLASFRPHLSGAVWRGTGTRLSDIYLQLFCDDAKSTEMTLIDMKIRYEAGTVPGFQGRPVSALSVRIASPVLAASVGLHLLIHDHDDLRGALKPDANGRSMRGDLGALRRLLAEESA